MDRLSQIRNAEMASHTEVYSAHALFAPGSWLAKPVKTVLDLLPMFQGCGRFRALDLGCGVGRNSIPLAQAFQEIPCRVDCVDILELAIDKLHQNARRFSVEGAIHGITAPIDSYEIGKNTYDLILAVSALEHVASKEVLIQKLEQIRDGIHTGGMVCLILNTSVQERSKLDGRELPAQFEVNLPTLEWKNVLERIFSQWQVVKYTVVHQKYDIPRENGLAELETDVVTYAAKKNS